MKLTVIVVNWNTRALLDQTLTTLYRETTATEFETIVVDNHSADDSVAMVREKFPQVRLIENDDNYGFAKANNQGMKIANGEYLMLLNSDTITLPGGIDRLVAYLDLHPDVMMVGPKVLNEDRTFQLACRRRLPDPLNSFLYLFGFAKLFPRSPFFNRYKRASDNPNVTEPVEAISGAAMMFRRAVYEKIGGLDEQFFFYGEDLDFCKRVGDQGWQIVFVSEAEIVHLGGGSSRQRRRSAIENFYDAMWRYYQKHFAFHPAIVRGVIWCGIMIRKWWALRRTA